MRKWEINSNWKSLAKPRIGDKVSLMFSDAFNYSVKVLIDQINNDNIIGTIEAVYDRGKGEITSGDQTSIVGKQVTFGPQVIYELFKNPKNYQ
jgi:hypothetical protein